ncbi:MAG TPA: hypothetical protein VH373_23535 [Jatrophihabitantaceae bacterium]
MIDMLPGYLTQPEADYRIQRLLEEAEARRMTRTAPTGDKPRRGVLTAGTRRAVSTYRRRHWRALRDLG